MSDNILLKKSGIYVDASLTDTDTTNFNAILSATEDTVQKSLDVLDDHTHTLNGLSDVTITSVADNELLVYDSSSGNWINQTPSEAGFDSIYLKLDGSNANTKVDIGLQDFQANDGTFASLIVNENIFAGNGHIAEIGDVTFGANSYAGVFRSNGDANGVLLAGDTWSFKTLDEQIRFDNAGQGHFDSSVTVGSTLILSSGSIVDSSGAISFGDENLTTTGENTANVFDMPTTIDETEGVINQNDIPFIHSFGTENFFAGGAGNFTLTTSTRNTGIGIDALKRLTNTGGNNVAIGWGALDSVTTASQNFGLGTSAGGGLTTGGSNTVIGTFGLLRVTTGINNTAIGRNVGLWCGDSSSQNVLIGNFIFGSTAVETDDMDYNTVLGYRIASSFNGTPARNTIVGALAATNMEGTHNIFLGYACATDETGSDTLMIDNRDRTSEALGRTGAIIYGIMDADPANQSITFNVGTHTVTGDSIWTGNGSGVPYGHMYVDGTQTIIVALTLNTPAEVKDDGTTSVDDGWLAGDLNLITFPTGGTEHYITITKPGVYHITWNLSFKMLTAGANTQIHGGLAVDGTAIRNKCEAHRTISNNVDVGNMAGSCMVDLPNGTEQLSLWMENTTNSNDADVVHGSITAVMVGGT